MREHRIIDLLFKLEECLVTGETIEFNPDNSYLRQCWELMDCRKKRCPAYGRKGVRCWQVIGTFCKPGNKQTGFWSKWSDCRQCPVFKAATPTRKARVQELINNIIASFSNENIAFGGARQKIKKNFDRLIMQFNFTVREQEILLLVLDRFTRKEIARELSISEETVKMHIKSLHRKLKAGSRNALTEKLLNACESAAPRLTKRVS